MPMKALSTCNSVGDAGFGCASTDGDSVLTDVGLLQEIPSISVCVRVCVKEEMFKFNGASRSYSSDLL